MGRAPTTRGPLKADRPLRAVTKQPPVAARPARRWGSFPTTADVGLWATGPSAEALLEGLGLALYALVSEPARVRPRETREVRAEGRDDAELVVAFLTELLALEDEDGFLARRIEVERSTGPPLRLLARLHGEVFDPDRHRPRTEVKAITYHDLEFDPVRGRARVIVDI